MGGCNNFNNRWIRLVKCPLFIQDVYECVCVHAGVCVCACNSRRTLVTDVFAGVFVRFY